MPTENPYPAPAPLVLADMLAMHAWSEHIDDHSRKLFQLHYGPQKGGAA